MLNLVLDEGRGIRAGQVFLPGQGWEGDGKRLVECGVLQERERGFLRITEASSGSGVHITW